MSNKLIIRLAHIGIRSDMPTLQDIVNKPSEEYFYYGKCEKCGFEIRVEKRKDRMMDCSHCGRVLKWKSRLRGTDSHDEYIHERARTMKERTIEENDY